MLYACDNLGMQQHFFSGLHIRPVILKTVTVLLPSVSTLVFLCLKIV